MGNYLQLVKVAWIVKKDFVATAAIVAGTALTLAKWQFVMQGSMAGCTVTTAIGWKNYQPKETSDKVYTGLPRFAKGETMKWVGLDATAAANLSGKANVVCGSGKALLGASHLVAGAAIAFGAA